MWYASVLSKNIDVLNAMMGGSRTRMLNILMQLRKCANHPHLFEAPSSRAPREWHVTRSQ